MKLFTKLTHYVCSPFKRNFCSKYVDSKDNEFFKKVNDWWSTDGSVRTLHSYNDIRIKFIKQEFIKEGLIDNQLEAHPFQNYNFIDIGCGGGLLCESLARLGGNVTGMDSNINSYEVAKGHLDLYRGNEAKYMKEKITYYNGSVDNYINDNPDKQFEVATAMEVIEHVNSPKDFLADISRLIKPGGFLFLSTINKNLLSYTVAILLAQETLGVIPKGTHEWEKFITVEEMTQYLNEAGFSLRNINGVFFNPLTENMSLINDTSINYILIAKKNN
jgi:ubiquinone biosynthesis O-methyltransferase